MEYEEKRIVIYELLELIKSKEINKYQKESVYDIVMNLPNKTINQKERFIKLYNLNSSLEKQYTLTTLANESKRSTNAIRTSVVSIKSALTRISDNDIMDLKNIIKEHR